MCGWKHSLQKPIPGFLGHTVDGLWEGKRALREQGLSGRLKQRVPSSPTPSSASRTTPSAHTAPSWKACTPSVPLMLLVLQHLTPTGSNWPSPPTPPLYPFAKKVPRKVIFCTLEKIRGNTIKTSRRMRIVILKSHAL